jgi:hypothetical protein
MPESGLTCNIITPTLNPRWYLIDVVVCRISIPRAPNPAEFGESPHLQRLSSLFTSDDRMGA